MVVARGLGHDKCRPTRKARLRQHLQIQPFNVDRQKVQAIGEMNFEQLIQRDRWHQGLSCQLPNGAKRRDVPCVQRRQLAVGCQVDADLLGVSRRHHSQIEDPITWPNTLELVDQLRVGLNE